MKRTRDKERLQKIAKERVAVLFEQAEQVFKKNPERANRYVKIARRIAQKVNLRMLKKHKGNLRVGEALARAAHQKFRQEQ